MQTREIKMTLEEKYQKLLNFARRISLPSLNDKAINLLKNSRFRGTQTWIANAIDARKTITEIGEVR